MFISVEPTPDAAHRWADYLQSQRNSWGFVPNYTAAFAGRADVAAAWNALILTIRDGMDRHRFEIATIAAARARRSTYCTVAHSKFLRDVCGDPDTLQQIADTPDGSSLVGADRVVYEFATLVASDPASITVDDIAVARAAGLDDTEIADVVFAAAARCFFTAVLDGAGAQVDPELADAFPQGTLQSMLVGRPVADR